LTNKRDPAIPFESASLTLVNGEPSPASLKNLQALYERAKIQEAELAKEATAATTKAGFGIAGTAALIGATSTGRDSIFIKGHETAWSVEFWCLIAGMGFFILGFYFSQLIVGPGLRDTKHINKLIDQEDWKTSLFIFNDLRDSLYLNRLSLNSVSFFLTGGFLSLVISTITLVYHLEVGGTVLYGTPASLVSPSCPPLGGTSNDEAKRRGADHASPKGQAEGKKTQGNFQGPAKKGKTLGPYLPD